MKGLLALLLAMLLSSCCTTHDTMNDTTANRIDPNTAMNSAAATYVRLVLALGEHDADYVDAYYGDPKIREEVRAEKATVAQIHDRAVAVRESLRGISRPADAMLALRLDYLRRQTDALITRSEMLSGRKLTFDEESQALYDAVAPHHDEAYFAALTARLGQELPGDGPLLDRLEAFRKEFVIPKEKLDDVFKAAIDGCRARTLQHVTLPPDENFRVEYVTNKSWSGYNWYQGGYKSLIQVNTDLPIYIDRAIDLACHEGYPGHHVYNALLEKNLVRDRGWIEFTVYPLFSPQSLIAEGSANYGIDVAFPANERVEFEKTHLFTIAGLDPSKAAQYYRIQDIVGQLGYAGNEAARHYLDGDWNAARAVDWLTRYALMAPERAKQRLRFIEQYRSYVINYNLGKDLVRGYVERNGGTASDPRRRWEIFTELLSSPRLPSALR
jgi:hypothetical protein